MSVGAGVDGSADLGHPQLHAVVGEDREGEPELVAVEGARRFADDDGLEAAVGSGQGVEKGGGLGPAHLHEWERGHVELLGARDAPGGAVVPVGAELFVGMSAAEPAGQSDTKRRASS